VCVQTCWCTYASPLSSLVFLLPSVYRCFSVLASHTTRRNVAAAVFPPLHFPTGSPSASSCGPFALVQSGCFSYSRWWWAQTAGFAIVGKCCCCKAASFSLYLPIVFRPHTHYPTRRGSRCLSAFYISLPAVRVHHPCEPHKAFCTRAIGVLLVQSLVVGADSGFRDRGEVRAAPESESELLSKKLGWVGVFATS
jgi:hypothetical protein